MKRAGKKVLGFLVSFLIILFLYSRLDVKGMVRALSSLNPFLLTCCFLLFIPQIGLITYRWKVLCSPYYDSGIKESLSLILSGQTMNLFLPSKMGSIAKVAFLRDHSVLDWRKGLDFVLLERGLDFAALSFWMVLGFLIKPISGSLELTGFLTGGAIILVVVAIYSGSWGEGENVERFLGRFHQRLGEGTGKLLKGAVLLKKDLSNNGSLLKAVIISIFLWVLHLGQFYLFFLSLGITGISLVTVFTLIPMGIYIGLLPLTSSGIGTRDAAFIYLFRTWVSPEKMALVGIFSLVRYLVPGILGLPFIGKNISSLRLSSKSMFSEE
ncbi:MAG: lysylphosphatidylglycerol synthase transmembrane domain-containing protein [bacterium]